MNAKPGDLHPVGQGDLGRLHLADDLADAVFVGKGVRVAREELLRILGRMLTERIDHAGRKGVTNEPH